MEPNRRSILLIDDDEEDYLIVRQLLSHLPGAGSKLTWVTDYDAALNSMENGSFDVCLMDYQLEDRNGLELLVEAVKRGFEAPIVFLTGHGDYELDLEAMKAGAADYITKAGMNAALLDRSIRYAIENQKKKSELLKAKRVIQSLSECNDALIRIKDEDQLLREICRIVVQVGGYRMAWVGYAGHDVEQTVTPVAHYGHEDGYLNAVQVTRQKGDSRECPTTACIRMGEPGIFRFVENPPDSAPWMVEAMKRGYGCAIGLPLFLEARILGALTIFSSHSDAFDSEEVDLLLKLSSNLSHGIASLRAHRARAYAEELLREAFNELEERVEERTSELVRVNKKLRREVEERLQAEEALRTSEQRFRDVIDATGEFIWEVDLKGCFTYISERVEAVLEYRPDEVLGRQFFGFAEKTESKRQEELLARQVQSKEGFRNYEHCISAKSGRLVLLSATGVPVINPAGELTGFRGATQDITARKQVEEEKEKLEAQLFHAQKMESVGRLAGGVAHDFNNMLGVILGHTELALDLVAAPDPIALDLQEIQKAARRSADLTRQLLAFARKQTISPKVLDLNETLSGMLKMLRRLIGEDIDLLWEPGRELWKVRIDPSQIDQILANLAVNARDATFGVGNITLKTENVLLDDGSFPDQPEFAAGEYVMVAMGDTGAGMSKEILAHIFEPFFTTKEVGKGTGLGLATVYGIVKQNSGVIEVSSRPGKGTTFRIYLPRFKAAVGKASTEQPVEKAQGGTETILLVEDDGAMLRLTKSILERLGYRVLAAPSPKQAILLAQEHSEDIHLLLTDVVMPEMNGRQLAELVCAIRPGLKFLYMSGYTADMIEHRGVLGAGVHFINKPFKRDHFAAKIRQALEDKDAVDPSPDSC